MIVNTTIVTGLLVDYGFDCYNNLDLDANSSF